jgi:alkylhydroperoxidase family enzyme
MPSSQTSGTLKAQTDQVERGVRPVDRMSDHPVELHRLRHLGGASLTGGIDGQYDEHHYYCQSERLAERQIVALKGSGSRMPRIPPAPLEQYAPLVGGDAPLRQQVYAQAPALAAAYLEFMGALRDKGRLPARLIELLRLRVAFHNQCRSCMAIRYYSGIEDGVTENLVCSLEKPQEAEDLTDAEKSALAYADRLATDHLSITDETFEELGRYFDAGEIMELCLQVGTFVGYGRMAASLAMTDDLPDDYADTGAVLAPWRNAPAEIVR